MDRQEQYKAFLKSDFGRHMISELKNLQAILQDEAAAQTTAEAGFGLLKESRGVIKALELFSTGAAFAQHREGENERIVPS